MIAQVDEAVPGSAREPGLINDAGQTCNPFGKQPLRRCSGHQPQGSIVIDEGLDGGKGHHQISQPK